MQDARVSSLYYHVCCFVLFAVAASISFNGYYQKYHFGEYGAHPNLRFGFQQMVDGTAYRPFVYRQLLPDVANWVDAITPQSAKDWWFTPRARRYTPPVPPANDIFESPVARSQTYFVRYLVMYIATFLFALLAVYAMHLVCKAMEMSPVVAVFAPIMLILLVPYVQSRGGTCYDFPELAFFALSVWIALKFDWWWIIPVAALGTWNKESFLFFIPSLYPIFRQRTSRLGALLGVGVLCLICLAVYYPIHLHFAHNPGGTAEIHLHEHLHSYLHPRHFLYGGWPLEETYGIMLPSTFTVMPMALLVWTAWRGWGHLPQVMRRHGKIAAAINLPLYLIFGFPGELRTLSLLYITFLLVLAANLSEWLAESMRPNTPVCAKRFRET
jgi:hypothetical protein